MQLSITVNDDAVKPGVGQLHHGRSLEIFMFGEVIIEIIDSHVAEEPFKDDDRHQENQDPG